MTTENKWFSIENAVKGANYATAFSATLEAGNTAAYGVDNILERMVYTHDPYDIAAMTATIAVLAGFKPTYSAARFVGQHYINKYRDLGEELKPAYQAVKKFDYQIAAYKAYCGATNLVFNILRPPVYERMKEERLTFISEGTAIATTGGLCLYSMDLVLKGLSFIDKHIDPYPIYSGLDNTFTTIATHPIQTIGLPALAGLGLATYTSIFGRSNRDRYND